MADALGLEQGSVLLADVGAPLYQSRLTIYDAAGLCEPELLQSLKAGTPVWRDDHPEFYELVLERLKPTFISTRRFWTLVTALELDPRFRRDYVAIDAYLDPYLEATYQRALHSGDFVRRDALPRPEDLERLRAILPGPRVQPWGWRLVDAWDVLRGRGPHDGDRAGELASAYARGDLDRAAALWQAQAREAPDNPGLALQVATTLDAAGRPGEARPHWQRVLALAHAHQDLQAARQASQRLGRQWAMATGPRGDGDAREPGARGPAGASWP